DPIAKRRECVAFARLPRTLDELDHADAVAAAKHAQSEAEGGRRLALSRSRVDDQQTLFDGLPGDLRVLHRLAFCHLGAMPIGHIGIDVLSHHFTFRGGRETSRTTRSPVSASR